MDPHVSTPGPQRGTRSAPLTSGSGPGADPDAAIASLVDPTRAGPVEWSDHDGDHLAQAAAAHRVLGPALLTVVESGADEPALTEALLHRLRGAMAWCLELELRLLEIAEWFDDAGGVEFLVLKGPAVAHLDEIDPSLRSFADLDLLVHARDMDRAIAALDRHGARRRIPQQRPGFDRRYSKGVGTQCGDGMEIDVHRTLCVGALGLRIPLDDLFARADSFEIGGRRFSALCLEHRALHAAYHAVVGSPTPALHTVRDLAQYLQRPELRPAVLTAEAKRWGGLTVLADAVRVTVESFGGLPPSWTEWLSEVRPDPDDLALIAASRTESSWPIEMSVLRALRWRERPGYVWAEVWPSAAVLTDRGQTRWSRLRDGIDAVRRSW